MRPALLSRWIVRRIVNEPGSARWIEAAAIVEDHRRSDGELRAPDSLLLDALHEGALEMRRVGRPEALRLAAAHAVKQLKFDHVVVLGASCDGWSREEHRRLLYVAMTRARETLTLLRSGAGRSGFFTDLSSSSSVHQVAPDFLPSPRADVERCQQGLMPRNVDVGWAGMFGTPHEAHRRIQELRPGDRLRIIDRLAVAGAEGGSWRSRSLGPSSPSKRRSSTSPCAVASRALRRGGDAWRSTSGRSC